MDRPVKGGYVQNLGTSGNLVWLDTEPVLWTFGYLEKLKEDGNASKIITDHFKVKVLPNFFQLHIFKFRKVYLKVHPHNTDWLICNVTYLQGQRQQNTVTDYDFLDYWRRIGMQESTWNLHGLLLFKNYFNSFDFLCSGQLNTKLPSIQTMKAQKVKTLKNLENNLLYFVPSTVIRLPWIGGWSYSPVVLTFCPDICPWSPWF